MELIAKNLQNSNLNTTSSSDIESQFVETFNNIFSFDNNDIEVIGTIEKPWFKAKDLLKILGYSDNVRTLKEFIRNNIPKKYKADRNNILRLCHPSSPITNKDKEIFISEAGLYRLVMRSNKPNAEPFQDFVQDVLTLHCMNYFLKYYFQDKFILKIKMHICISMQCRVNTKY